MPKFQTEIQNEDAIRLGSCMLEVAPYSAETPVFVNLGAMKGVKIGEKLEIAKITPDNAPEIERVKNQTIVTTGEWMEPTLTGLSTLRGGFDTLTSVAGTDTLKSGGKTTLGHLTIRLTNTNAADKTYQILIHKAKITKGLEQSWGADDALTPASIPLEIEGKLDPSKPVGEQLFDIIDKQAPSTPAV